MHDELGMRMKTYYEQVSKTRLTRRIPVAVRIDGRAFHTFCKHLKKPFDDVFAKTMQWTMKRLCEEIQGCVFGYTQSDEITLILTDYAHINSSVFFDYEVQKMCSVIASMATLIFNQSFEDRAKQVIEDYMESWHIDEDEVNYCHALNACIRSGAMFDCRVFNIPKEEVVNLLIWRQSDARRNSVNMLARAYFTHSEIQHKSTDELIELLYNKYRIDWLSLPITYQHGAACVKKPYNLSDGRVRMRWTIDDAMPVLAVNHNYVFDVLDTVEKC